jgi:ElaB/YqjD/DUF883 family membrane-anchored ribosome-binding protein
MTEENIPPQDEQSKSSSDSWQEVGRQFQDLGSSLAATMRAAWENEATRQRMQDVQNGLESMVDQVGQAIHDTVESPQGQQAKAEAKKAMNSFQDAFEQTADEVRPQLVSALRQVNAELQNLIDRLKKE